jgi:hypothetical protein
MSDNEERRVKARHDVTQFHQGMKDVSRREMPRGVIKLVVIQIPTTPPAAQMMI